MTPSSAAPDDSRIETKGSPPIASTLSAQGRGGDATEGAPRSALVVLLCVQICFAVFPVAGRIARGGFGAPAVAAWRVGVGAVVLLLLAFLIHRRRTWPGPRELLRMALVGQLGVTLNQILFVEGLWRSTAVNASLILAFIPVATYAFAVSLRYERFHRVRAFGVLLATAGCASLLVGRGHDGRTATALGNVMLIGNAACYALYLVLVRPLVQRHPPLVVTAWVFVTSLPAVLWYARNEVLLPSSATPSQRWALCVILLFPTILAYSLNAVALVRIPASVTASWVYLQPLLSIIGAILFLEEPLGWHQGLAGVMVLLGVLFVTRSAKRTRQGERLARDECQPRAPSN